MKLTKSEFLKRCWSGEIDILHKSVFVDDVFDDSFQGLGITINLTDKIILCCYENGHFEVYDISEG